METSGLKIHGLPVRAWATTEFQGEPNAPVACGIVVVEKSNGSAYRSEAEYVTAWYRDGDREWSNGHYFRGEGSYREALEDFWDRVHQATRKDL